MRNFLVILVSLFSHIAFSQCVPFQVYVNSTNVSCNAYNDGNAIIDSTGGTPPFQYFWQGSNNFSSNDSVIDNLSPGTYQLTVVDSNNCVSIPTLFTINEPDFGISLSSTDISCFGANDGIVSVNVVGGQYPLSYLWSNGLNTISINNLSPNTYSLTITDDNGCEKEDSVTVSQPDSLNLFIDTIIEVSCFGNNDGFIKVDYTGGTAPCTFLWTAVLNNNQNYFASGPSRGRSFLYAGEYTITATDQNNCQEIIDVTLLEPSQLQLSSIIDSVSCNGFNDALITVLPSGGTFPYYYQWSTNEQSQTIDSVSPAIYTVLVTDNNFCTESDTFIISEPSELIINSQVNNPSCYSFTDASINLTVSGGAVPYSFVWNNGFTNSNNNSLSSGIYSVFITDNNNCVLSDTFEILDPPELILQLDSLIDINCFGDNNSYIEVNAFGGITPYEFSWSDSSLNNSIRDDLYAGNYNVYVSDANNCIDNLNFDILQAEEIQVQYTVVPNVCTGDSSASVQIDSVFGGIGSYSYSWSNSSNLLFQQNIFQDSLIFYLSDSVNCQNESLIIIPNTDSMIVNFSVSDVSCYGSSDGSITTNILGGTPPYNYLWSTLDSTNNLQNLPSSVYQLTVSDSNNCLLSTSTFISSPFPLLTISTNIINLSCSSSSDGEINISSTGGTPPYNYVWSNGMIGDNIDSLQSGSYILTTSDVNFCSTNNTFVVSEPSNLQSVSQVQDVSCNSYSDGSIEVIVSGGTPPYSHLWNTNDTNNILVNSAGIFIDSIYDANSCLYIVTDTIEEPTSLQLNIQKSDVSCFGGSNGSAHLQLSGGTVPYFYEWNGVSGTNINDTLSSANILINVYDDNNCNILDTIFINQPQDSLSSLINVDDVSCYQYQDGQATISVSGGTTPYSYLWHNSDTTNNISGIASGTYSVIVSDGNNCVDTFTYEINSPDSILVNVITNDVSCFGDNDGSASLNITGGNPPYTFLWDNGSNLNQITGLEANLYSVIITDSTNCEKVENYSISEPSQLLVNVETTNISCFGFDDGIINVEISGGTIPYSFLWANGSDDLDLDSLEDGIYTINISDGNNCSTLGIGIINEPIELDISSTTIDASCYDLSDGSINIQISGGVPPYYYLWNNNSTIEDLTYIPYGNYSVEIYDNNDCFLYFEDSVSQPDSIYIEHNLNNESCLGEQDGSIYVDVFGGSVPYIYSWSNNETTDNITDLLSGFYMLSIMDNNNCISEEVFEISSENSCINIPNVFTPNGDGINDSWSIRNLEDYLSVSIIVVDEFGKILYESDLKSSFWDGSYNGDTLGSGTYYYYIKLDDELFTGSISIVR